MTNTNKSHRVKGTAQLLPLVVHGQTVRQRMEKVNAKYTRKLTTTTTNNTNMLILGYVRSNIPKYF